MPFLGLLVSQLCMTLSKCFIPNSNFIMSLFLSFNTTSNLSARTCVGIRTVHSSPGIGPIAGHVATFCPSTHTLTRVYVRLALGTLAWPSVGRSKPFVILSSHAGEGPKSASEVHVCGSSASSRVVDSSDMRSRFSHTHIICKSSLLGVGDER
jgi:hypothetical protein